jgi:hypothetical protein
VRHWLHALVVVAVATVLVAPLAADAARPKPGRFLNCSQASGLDLETTRRTITQLWFFCENELDPQRPEYREARYEVTALVRIRRSGRFSFRGKAKRYGPEGQPLGRWRVRLRGRFTSPRRVRIRRTLSGCDTRTVSARRVGPS